MPFTSKMHKNQPVTGMHWDCFGFQGLHDVRLLEHVADYPTTILNLWPPSGLKYWSLGFKWQHPWVVPSTLATFRSLGFQAYGNLQEMLLQSCLGNPHSSRSSEEMVERSRDLVLFLGMTGLINFHYWDWNLCKSWCFLGSNKQQTDQKRLMSLRHLFKTTRKTHSVIFTSGATQSLQLLGEHYPWKSTTTGGCFLYADESHTSPIGLEIGVVLKGFAGVRTHVSMLKHGDHFGWMSFPFKTTQLREWHAGWSGKSLGTWPGCLRPNQSGCPGFRNRSGEAKQFLWWACVKELQLNKPWKHSGDSDMRVA